MAVQALSREFLSHLEDHQENGLTCELLPATFVSRSTLRDYWTLEKIEAVWRHAPITTHLTLIRRRYFIVLSILVAVFNTESHALEFFDTLVSDRNDDSTLPWTEPPKALRGSFNPHADAVYKAFEAVQWPFCPVLLEMTNPLSNARLDRRRIFPFVDRRDIGDSPVNAEAKVCSVGIQPLAHKHLPNASQPPSQVVLKTYPQAFQQAYDKERKAYAALSTKANNVLRCFGSFYCLSENGVRTSTLIFEFAEKGTLSDLFEQGRNPYDARGVFSIWESFLGVIKALEMVHEQRGLRAIHQDLKPSNVLVFPSQKAEEPFAYVLKISDFGACHIPAEELPHNGHDPDAIYARTGRTYSAPELYLGEEIRYGVDSRIDMWSVGCMLIETAVWITLGEQGREDFRNMRIEETSKLPEHEPRGRIDCFHDGFKVLRSVANVQDLIRPNQRPDNISSQIVQLALQHLLVDQHFRAPAGQIYQRLAKLIHSSRISEETAAPQRQNPRLLVPTRTVTAPPSPGAFGGPTHPPRFSDSSSRLSTGSLIATDKETAAYPLRNESLTELTDPSTKDRPAVRLYPLVSIEDLRSWRENSHTPTLSTLKGWKQVERQLKGRDFIFIVDNSVTMQRYKDDILLFVYQLGYLVKRLDPNGFEVLMTSDPLTKETFNTSTHIKSAVSSKFRSGTLPCNMEHTLEQAFKSVYKTLPRLAPVGNKKALVNMVFHRRAKPFTILVFTDGVWDGSEHGLSGTDVPIEKCIQMMKKYGVSRTDVAIQFVRFGHDKTGQWRLTYLDDGLKKRPQNHGYDIVDHKYRDSGIWDILVGSVFGANDESEGTDASKANSD